MIAKPKTIDEYLAALNDEQRRALEKLRKTIKAAAPQAEESISYGLAAFRQNGMLVGFGATPNHCALYLMSGTILKGFKNELKDMTSARARFGFIRKTLYRCRWCEDWSKQGSRKTRPF